MSKIAGKPVNADFFAEADDGPVVVGSRCSSCKRVYFPSKRVCSECWIIDDMEIVPLARRGRLLTYSVAFNPFMGIRAPYAFGYVELEDGVRLYSLLTDCEPFDEKLRTGCAVEMVIEFMAKDEFGDDVYCYKFRPIQSAPAGPAERRHEKGLS